MGYQKNYLKKISYLKAISIAFIMVLSTANSQKILPNVVTNLDFNTKYAEFGAIFYQSNMILFASSMKDESLQKRNRRNNRQMYLKFYTGNITNNGDVIDIKPYTTQQDNPIFEADITFSSDHKTVYFTRNNYIYDGYNKTFRQTAKNKRILHIFKADISSSGGLSNIVAMPFNGNDYSVSNPRLNPNDNKLFFISDMESSYGGTDIYVVDILADGGYSDPKNLGDEVNSIDDEITPFLSNKGVLYFSSNRHSGKGEFDIYSAELVNGTYKNPTSLDEPINSSFDDFSFIINPNKNIGYFSSTRNDGKGNVDIYSFLLDEKEMIPVLTTEPIIIECVQIVNGKITDILSGNPIVNAQVIIYDTNGDRIGEEKTNNNGNYHINIPCNGKFNATVSMEQYKPASKGFVTNKIEAVIQRIDFALASDICVQTISGVIANSFSKTPISDAEITVSDSSGEIKTIISNSNGYFSLEVNCNSNYTISVTKKDFTTVTKEITTNDIQSTDNTIPIILKPTVNYITVRDQLMIVTEPIEFDLNSSSINESAAIELNKVVATMNKFPEIKVELKSHTDSRAPDNYNLNLSEARAKSMEAYIISKGISADRITGKGYGETELLNKCSNGIRCSESEHLENRRTEFIVLK